jgi:hypothetical protein
MSKARNLADLLDASGDVVSGALDNVPPSNDASALTTGTLPIARIADGDITAAKLGSTLDLSGKTVTLPAGTGGKVLQVVSAEFTGAYAASHAGFANRKTLASLSITPISSSSKLIMHGIFHHGIGPAATNLDGWGHNFGWETGGSSIAVLKHDVWPGAFTSYVSYGPEWFTTTEVVQKIETGHTAGVSKTYKAYVYTDSGNSVLINRCHTSTDTRGLCSFTLMEVL